MAMSVLILLCIGVGYASSAAAQTTAVTTTYRQLVSATSDPAWIDGDDALADLGFEMSPAQMGALDKPSRHVQTPLGQIELDGGDQQFYSMDFFAAYQIPTFWPYCQSLTQCLVFSQKAELRRAGRPVTLTLPLSGAVQAVDLYVDLAIDCVGVLAITVECEAIAYPGPVVVKAQLASVCGSPEVGVYLGFYNLKEGLHNVSITCPTAYARAVGLLRVGRMPEQQGLHMHATIQAGQTIDA